MSELNYALLILTSFLLISRVRVEGRLLSHALEIERLKLTAQIETRRNALQKKLDAERSLSESTRPSNIACRGEEMAFEALEELGRLLKSGKPHGDKLETKRLNGEQAGDETP